MTSYIALALTCAALAAPCFAQEENTAPDRHVLVVRGADRHPATATAARQLLARIDRAAMVVCGASSVDLREVRQDVRRSTCWRDSMVDAVGRINDPRLSQAWQGRVVRTASR